jgi:hypothetical protein
MYSPTEPQALHAVLNEAGNTTSPADAVPLMASAGGRPKERSESSREALDAVKDYLQPDCQKVRPMLSEKAVLKCTVKLYPLALVRTAEHAVLAGECITTAPGVVCLVATCLLTAGRTAKVGCLAQGHS